MVSTLLEELEDVRGSLRVIVLALTWPLQHALDWVEQWGRR